MGHSVGRWEGDTLVVDVTQFQRQDLVRPRRQFPQRRAARRRALHADHVPTRIRYEATIEDPKVFTRPWTIAMPHLPPAGAEHPAPRLPCIDFTEEFLYGHLRKQQLVKHWEGETIAVDITRKVPPGERLFEWVREVTAEEAESMPMKLTVVVMMRWSVARGHQRCRCGRTTRLPPSSTRTSRSTSRAQSPKMEWINPHVWLHMDVKKPDGSMRELGVRGRHTERPVPARLHQGVAAAGNESRSRRAIRRRTA